MFSQTPRYSGGQGHLNISSNRFGNSSGRVRKIDEIEVASIGV